jgi:hypothetical protein
LHHDLESVGINKPAALRLEIMTYRPKSLADIIRLVPPPAQPMGIDPKAGWRAADRRFGIAFPDDYKQLIATYGSGEFCGGGSGYLTILNPLAKDSRRTIEFRIHNYRYLQSLDPQFYPFPGHPEPEGLFPMATGNQVDFYFRPRLDGTYDVVWDSKNEVRWPEKCGFVEFRRVTFTTFWWHYFSNRIEKDFFSEPVRFFPQAPPAKLTPEQAQLAQAGLDLLSPKVTISVSRPKKKKTVEPRLVPADSTTRLKIGSAVACQSGGLGWWSAEVIGFETDGRVKVRFPGWDDSWDVTVPREGLRVEARGSSRKRARPPSKSRPLDLILPDDLPDITITFSPPTRKKPAGSISVDSQTPLTIGSAVLCNEGGWGWYPAEVIAFEPDGRVKVHYPGWEDSWDVSVPREELRVKAPRGSSRKKR